MPPRRLLSPTVRHLVPIVLYAAVAAITVAIVRSDPAESLAGDSVAALTWELLAGGLLIAAVATTRSPLPLTATALVWPLREWNSPSAGAAFTVGLVLYAAWPPLLAAAVLSRGRPSAVLVAVAAATSVGVLGLASATVFDPRAQGCSECPTNHLLVHGDAAAWPDLGQFGLVLTVAWVAALVVIALRSGRPSTWPVLVPAVTAAALFAAEAAHGASRGFLSNDPTDRRLWTGQTAAVTLVAAGVAWERVRARRTRAALARLVVDFGASPSAGGLRERLAAMLDDPSLELVYRPDDGVGWIDAQGRAADPSPADGREVTRITAAGRDLSALVHRRGVLDDPAVVAGIADAAQLAIEHERLHASRRAHLVELQASRARLVAHADAERRRLERDLHDGAQQRLVALAVGFRLARRRIAGADLDGELAAAEEALKTATGELRELAHGLFPAVLAEEGLGAALEGLCERIPPLVLVAVPTQRCASAAESAAYAVVVEAARLASAGDVRVEAAVTDGRLVVEVRPGFTPPILMEDRVGAVGGTVVATAESLRAELPCAS